MNEDPTPRKSDIHIHSKSNNEDRRASLNGNGNSVGSGGQGKTYDLRKSIDSSFDSNNRVIAVFEAP